MNIKLFFSAIVLIYCTQIFSQASLPSSYSWDGSPIPNGWTENLNVVAGATTYAGGSDLSPSCRLDGTGENVQVFFSNPCGAVSYYLKGTGISQPAATGTVFEIQESVNGAVWTTLRTLNSSNIQGTFTLYSDQPSANANYIRFYYTTKVSGSNIALDQVSIAAPAAGSNAALELKFGSQSIPNGGTLFIGNNTSNVLTLKNNGLDSTLKIFSSGITGVNASDFSLSAVPATVATTGSSNFNLNFTAGAGGSRYATLTITDNDPFNNPYTISIYGIGGLYATEPATPPCCLGFNNAKSYTFDIDFINPSTIPDGYVILQKKGPLTEIPTDGMSYKVGDYIGQAMVAYVGSSTHFVPHHIFANTAYHYAIFPYNGPAGYENYLTASPLAGIAWTANGNPGSYYNTINVNNSTFVSDLSTLINPHTQIFYSDYDITLIDKMEKRDTTQQRKAISCVYSGYNYVYTEPWVFDTISREHVFCHSWFPNYPATNWWGYSDLHNLFPAHQNGANALRSNNPVGEVVNPTNIFYGCMKGTDAGGNTVFEPKADIKGNIARAMFYMMTCYNGDSGNNWLLPAIQNQQVLKDWNYQDPPDAYEIARNEYIQSVQGNRNPFVDHPNWACYIDFYTMAYISSPTGICLLAGNEEENYLSSAFIIQNNGTHDPKLIYKGEATIKCSLTVTDIQGKLIFDATNKELKNGEAFDTGHENLEPGIYFYTLQENDRHLTLKLLKSCD